MRMVGTMAIHKDDTMGKARRNVVRFMWLSILLFAVSFVTLWWQWALWPALAVVGLMMVAWLLGAMFALAVVPADDYQHYVDQYREAVDGDKSTK